MIGSVTVESLGLLTPGASGIGLIQGGSLTLKPGSIFATSVNSPIGAGVGFDQYSATGSVDVSNATLLLNGSITTSGVITLINNDGNDAVVGEFVGYPQNSLVNLNSLTFVILYNGGDGNDVVLVPLNQAPTVSPNAAAVAGPEGSVITNSGTFSDAQGNSTVTLSASVGTIVQNNSTGEWSWSIPAPDGPFGPATVTITATDNLGQVTTATFVYSVGNVAPSIVLSGSPTVDEGSIYTLNLGKVTDPGQDTITSYTIDWGDGVIESFTGSPENTIATHIYADGPASRLHSVRVTDEDGNFLAGSLTVLVENVAPTVTGLASDFSAFCNASKDGEINILGSFTDQGTIHTR